MVKRTFKQTRKQQRKERKMRQKSRLARNNDLIPSIVTDAPTTTPATKAPSPQPETPVPTQTTTAAPTSDTTTTAAPTSSTTTMAPSSTTTAPPTSSPTTESPTPSTTTNAPTPHPTTAPTSTSTTTAAPTPSPTPTPTKNPTPTPTKNPTPAPTLAPTKNPTPNPTPNPTKAPTPNPTPNPTAAPTPEEHENCMIIREGIVTVIEPSSTTTPASSLYNSQCIMVPANPNIIRIAAEYVTAVPANSYQTMLITSLPLNDEDVMNVDTKELMLCQDICAGMTATDCQCIEGMARTQPSLTPISSMNSLYFTVEQTTQTSTQQAMAKYFTVFSDVERNILKQTVSIHSQLLPTYPVTMPVNFQLAPKQRTNLLLSNVNWVGKTSGRVQKVVMKLPMQEEDCLLEMTIEPLFYSEDESVISSWTERCILDDDPRCQVWLNPSLDYNVRVENIGRITDNIQLDVVQYPTPVATTSIDDIVSKTHSALPMKYVIAGASFMFIWVLAIILIIAAFKKGNKATKKFVNGMTGIFSSKKKHYMQQAWVDDESVTNSQEEEQQHHYGILQA